jgi:hypothetical protein
MNEGIEHFGKLLKKAYDLPLTGMSVSLIFSLSHAYIEGSFQMRKYGKAETTVNKLREIAEYAENNTIPHAVANVADRLHLWWRDKLSTLYNRQVRSHSTGGFLTARNTRLSSYYYCILINDCIN